MDVCGVNGDRAEHLKIKGNFLVAMLLTHPRDLRS